MKLNFTDYVLPDQDRQRPPPDTDSDMPSSVLTSCSSTRQPQSTPGTTPAPSHLPTPRNWGPPPLPFLVVDAEAASTTKGRERRVRKSVNYAEPKLNTYVWYSITLLSDLTAFNRKMHKPDAVTQVKRSSSGGFLHAAATAADADIPMIMKRRRKSPPRLPVDDDEESDGSHADEEPLAGSRVLTGMANVDTRRRSAVVPL